MAEKVDVEVLTYFHVFSTASYENKVFGMPPPSMCVSSYVPFANA
jgi:hypothetical protein